MEHDKYKDCIGCPDRVADPNCHDKCEGYKYRQDKQAKLNEGRRRELEYLEVKISAVRSTQKRLRQGGLKNNTRGKKK
jgi:hypothetical protein